MLPLRFALLAAALVACRGEPPAPAADDTDTDTDGDTDTDPAPDPSAACDALSLPSEPFSAGPYGATWDAIADDFVLPTLDGDFSFRDTWTGCDSTLFLLYGAEDAAFGGPDVKALLERLPPNTRVIVMSYAAGAAVDDDMATLSSRFADKLAALGLEETFAGRVHFVTRSATNTDTWVSDFLTAAGEPSAFAIDRFQRVRETGFFGDPSAGWAESVAFAAYEAWRFDAEWEQAAALDAADTVIRAFDGVYASDGSWSGQSSYADVTLPDAAGMAAYDTLELDLTLACGHPEPTTCGAWDYLVNLYLCDADDPDVCDTELGRWITPYARGGRWVTDASPMLALLRDGGPRRLRFYTTQGYTTTLDLRLGVRGKAGRPTAATSLFGGGAWDETYNSAREPVTVDIPATATRVELYAVITGHGYGQDRENCAEFCNHQHEFIVNGAVYLREFPEAGSAEGCIEAVPDGAVPNQYGTWPYGRGGWCPGQEVEPWVIDVTASVTPGEPATITYRGLYEGEDYVPQWSDSGSGFAGRVDVVSYLVVAE